MSRGKILVVDDEKMIRGLMQRLFSGEYDIDTAENGSEALKKISACRPDLVFLDLLMPGVSGLELLGNMLKIPGLKIVVMTGLAFEDVKNTALELGAAGFIYKPFTIEEVGKFVSRFFGKD
jgi:CheY-like chemotaxis protein